MAGRGRTVGVKGFGQVTEKAAFTQAEAGCKRSLGVATARFCVLFPDTAALLLPAGPTQVLAKMGQLQRLFMQQTAVADAWAMAKEAERVAKEKAAAAAGAKLGSCTTQGVYGMCM